MLFSFKMQRVLIPSIFLVQFFGCKLQFWGHEISKVIPENIWLYETDIA